MQRPTAEAELERLACACLATPYRPGPSAPLLPATQLLPADAWQKGDATGEALADAPAAKAGRHEQMATACPAPAPEVRKRPLCSLETSTENLPERKRVHLASSRIDRHPSAWW